MVDVIVDKIDFILTGTHNGLVVDLIVDEISFILAGTHSGIVVDDIMTFLIK